MAHQRKQGSSREELYEQLGVSPGASSEALKRAYRHLALRFHPDVNRDPTAPEKFQKIRDAYQQLLAGGGEKQRPWWRGRWLDQLKGLHVRGESADAVQTRRVRRRRPPTCTPDPTQQPAHDEGRHAAAAHTVPLHTGASAAGSAAGAGASGYIDFEPLRPAEGAPLSSQEGAWVGTGAFAHAAHAEGTEGAEGAEPLLSVEAELEAHVARQRVHSQLQGLKDRSSRRNAARGGGAHASSAGSAGSASSSAASSADAVPSAARSRSRSREAAAAATASNSA